MARSVLTLLQAYLRVSHFRRQNDVFLVYHAIHDKSINEQIKKMHKNKDNDSKMSYNGVANPTKELKGDVVLWIIAYTIQRKFSRAWRK